MKKIPCLFNIDHEAHVALNSINPKAAFLLEHPEATATIKRDGTATLLTEDGNWYARRSVKAGKNAPAGFIHAETDPNTGTTFGWEPMETSPMAKFHRRALENIDFTPTPGTTLELCGAKINGNPEGLNVDWLFPHGGETPEGFPAMAEIAAHADDPMGFLLPWFSEFRDAGIEGVVWWLDGAPAVKARVKDLFPEDSTWK